MGNIMVCDMINGHISSYAY